MAELAAPATVFIVYTVAAWLVERSRVRWWIVGALATWAAVGAATWAMLPFLRDNMLALVLWGFAIAECIVWTVAVFRCYLPHPAHAGTEPEAPAGEYASTTRVYKYVGRKD
jgi:thiol:disulfide interchange protein